MEFKTIEKIVKDSLNMLFENDKVLIENDVNERSITHRLALYIENYLSDSCTEEMKGLSVDCEYNRNWDLEPYSPKKLSWDSEELKDLIDEFDLSPGKVLEFSCYPDIIVHQRGKNENNILVVEVKKQSSKLKDEKYDLCKVKAFTEESENNKYKYQFGVFIKLVLIDEKNKSECRWYIDGEEYSP